MHRDGEVDQSAVGQLPSVDVIIVCFDSVIALEETLTFMQRTEFDTSAVRFSVVNNSLHDSDEISQICAAFGVRFLQMSENVGFGAAVNRGASVSDGSYILLLSPGSLVSARAIDALRRSALGRPDCVGLGLVNESASGRLSYKVKTVVDFGFKRNIAARLKSRGMETVPTSFISGGGFMVKRTAFEKIGGFDEKIFLFHEDDDFSARLSAIGNLAYVLSARCLHRRNVKARNDMELRRVRGWHLGHSKLYVLRKHRGRLGVTLAIAGTVLSVMSPVYFISKSRRVKTNAFIAGTIAGLQGVPASNGLLPAL